MEINRSFNENLSFHPLYSCYVVNIGQLQRFVRVHLLFITIAAHIAIISHETALNASLTMKVFWACLGSVPFNYLFGVLARFMASGDKPTGRAMFAAFVEIGIFTMLVYSIGQIMSSPGHSLLDIGALIASLIVDFLVIDVIVTKVASVVPALKGILRFRGFYTQEVDGDRQSLATARP